MPDKTAEAMIAASEKLGRATTPEERKQAAREMVEAEKRHFDALGVHREEAPMLGRIISGVLVLLLAVLLILNLALTAETRTTAGDVQDLQIANVIAARETCERGNSSRTTNVQNLEDDVKTLKGQRNLWEAFLAVSPPGALEASPEPVRDAFFDNLRKLREGITHKEKSVARTIASQAAVAIHPGSPEVDCAAANPLPGEVQLRPHRPHRQRKSQLPSKP